MSRIYGAFLFGFLKESKKDLSGFRKASRALNPKP